MGASTPLACTRYQAFCWCLKACYRLPFREYENTLYAIQMISNAQEVLCQIYIIICLHNHIVYSNLKISLLNQQPESFSQISTSAQNFKQLRIFSGDCRPLYKPNQKPAIPINGRRGLCRYFGMLDQPSLYGESHHLLFKKSWHYQSFVM